jgi:hypothetical protein
LQGLAKGFPSGAILKFVFADHGKFVRFHANPSA